MKLLHSTRVVDIPEGLSLEVKARNVRVKGPRGEQMAGVFSPQPFFWWPCVRLKATWGTEGWRQRLSARQGRRTAGPDCCPAPVHTEVAGLACSARARRSRA